MTSLNFIKAHGLGNDFVIFTELSYSKINTKLVKHICDRKTGVGCDLAVFLKTSDKNYVDIVLRFFNRDGSEAEICGNALRCIGKYYFEKFNKSNITVETHSGLIDVEKYNQDKIAVDLGKPKLEWEKIPLSFETDTMNLNLDFKYLKGGFAVNIGNPHLVFFVDVINEEKLEKDSKEILKKKIFPNGVNVSIVKLVSKNEINILTFERGVGITSACGSGAGAAVFASYKLNLCDKKVKVRMSGGDLNIEITGDEHILTIGDACLVFEGKIKLDGF